MALLKEQCAFGPRPVGSGAHAKTRDYLVDRMKALADKTYVQDFTYRTMPLTNVVGVFNPSATRRVMLCAHWDTRPRADMEIDPAKAARPILGANDGASGVAVLLEMARCLKAKPPKVGVVLVLLDGEDFGNFERDEGVFLGSRRFARAPSEFGHLDYGILLDMIGDANLEIPREGNSEQLAGKVNDKVYAAAKALGHGAIFTDQVKFTISDDHMPLNRAGIPTIDLIDFDYGPWHTLDDTPDKCSAKSLSVVGDVLLSVLYSEGLR